MPRCRRRASTISPFVSQPEIIAKIIICCQHALWSVNLFVLARALSRCRRGRRLMAVARCARHSKMLGIIIESLERGCSDSFRRTTKQPNEKLQQNISFNLVINSTAERKIQNSTLMRGYYLSSVSMNILK